MFSASPRSDARCSRNCRTSGSRVSSGECDLHDATTFALPLHQQLVINRARLVAIETEPKRVPELIELERLRAAAVGTVQKGTVRNGFRHADTHCVIGTRIRAPAILWSRPRPPLHPAVSGPSDRGTL